MQLSILYNALFNKRLVDSQLLVLYNILFNKRFVDLRLLVYDVFASLSAISLFLKKNIIYILISLKDSFFKLKKIEIIEFYLIFKFEVEIEAIN